jgi:DNA-binding CsgD family transcriptional regulator
MLPISLAILDAAGKIVSVNAAWQAFGRNNGLRTARSGIGQNYLRYCSAGSDETRDFGQQLKSVLARSRATASLVYRCDSARKRRLFLALAVQLGSESSAGAALLHVNVSSIFNSMRVEMEQLGSLSSMIERLSFKAITQQLTGEEFLKWIDGSGTDLRLTPRQKDVFRLLAEGRDNKEIANLLGRSSNTVKIHVAQIIKRLGVKNRTEAASLYFRLGLEKSHARRHRRN